MQRPEEEAEVSGAAGKPRIAETPELSLLTEILSVARVESSPFHSQMRPPQKGDNVPNSQGPQVAVEDVLLEIHQYEERGWLSE